MLPTKALGKRRSERIKQRTRSTVEQHYPHSPRNPVVENISGHDSNNSHSDDWIASWIHQTLTARGGCEDQPDLTSKAKGKPSSRVRENEPVERNEPSLETPSDITKSSRSWSVARQIEMESHGIFMKLESHQALNQVSQQLYRDILGARYPIPAWFYDTTKFQKMLDLVGKRSEASMTRHLTPILVPSPEMLQIEGVWDSEHLIAETWGSIWTKNCATLLPVLPKPDVVLGISHSAFTIDETAKLRSHNLLLTVDGEQLHYPFLTCEVKGLKSPIGEAELQAMHAASTVINAILRLCSHSTELYNQLNGQVLGFSLAHNSVEANLYGHFAMINDQNNNITFHRHELYHVRLANISTSKEVWTRPYQIILGICEHFVPPYLRMIKTAIATLPDAVATQMAGIDDSMDDEAAESSTHESELQREVDELKKRLDQTAQQTAQKDEQMTRMTQVMAQMAQERAQKDQQMAQLIEHIAQEGAERGQQIERMIRQMGQPQITMKKRKR